MRIVKMMMATMTLILVIGAVWFLLTAIEENREDATATSAQQSEIVAAKDSETPQDDSSSAHAVKKASSAVAAKKVSAPYVSQKPELPNGCEVTSLTMLLRSAGVKADKLTLARQIRKVPYRSGAYRGNPNEGFVGNMYHGSRSNPGYAVYHGPVAGLARKYLGTRIIDMSGQPWSAVEKQLASGQPVWTITSINAQPIPASEWRVWPTKSGALHISFKEHSVLLVGFDEHYVYFNDPLAGAPGSKAEKSSFVKAWTQFGNQAISIRAQ